MRGRSGTDSGQAGAEAEERSPGCRAYSEADAGRQFSTHLDADSPESGSTATSAAPASPGGNADPSNESTPGRGHERRHTAQEGVVEREGSSTVGVTVVNALDGTAPAGTIGVTGAVRSQH